MSENVGTDHQIPKPGPTSSPNAQQSAVGPGIIIQPPLTRRGLGPPLLLLVDQGLDVQSHKKTLDPPPLIKWAEEGFCVAQLQALPVSADASFGEAKSLASQVLLAALEIAKREECVPKDKIGLVGEWEAFGLTDKRKFHAG
jgi:hypothetical protein